MLTTDQLSCVLFTNQDTCRHRLHALKHIGFVNRFVYRPLGGPNSVCWVPGPMSARYVALARDQAPPTARVLRERQDRTVSSPTLAHLLATNQFFIRLLVHARRHPGTGLLRWWSEKATAGAFGQRVRPDGHGVWHDGNNSTGFYVEVDRGTERLAALVAKLAPHRRLVAEGGPSWPVLFALPSRLREQNLHRRLAERPEPTVTVATTSPEAGDDPAGPVWRVAGNGRHRLNLADLPSSHGEPGPLNPAAPTREQHPLRLLM